jgi:hypothetical protein
MPHVCVVCAAFPLTFLHASAAALTMKSLTDSLPLPAREALMSSRADSRESIWGGGRYKTGSSSSSSSQVSWREGIQQYCSRGELAHSPPHLQHHSKTQTPPRSWVHMYMHACMSMSMCTCACTCTCVHHVHARPLPAHLALHGEVVVWDGQLALQQPLSCHLLDVVHLGGGVEGCVC